MCVCASINKIFISLRINRISFNIELHDGIITLLPIQNMVNNVRANVGNTSDKKYFLNKKKSWRVKIFKLHKILYVADARNIYVSILN